MRLKLVAMMAAVAGMPLLAEAPAAAQNMTISFSQVGGNVVTTGSGSLNLAGLTYLGSGANFASVEPSFATVLVGGGNDGVYSGLTGPNAFGPGGFAQPTSFTGGVFGFSQSSGFLYVAQDYVSLSAITSTATYNGATFASLGLTQGVYTYLDGANTITVQIGDAVPEPASWAMIIGGFAVAGGALRMRRRKALRAI